jgi:hypothetical protein
VTTGLQVLTSRPPADISVIVLLLCYRELSGARAVAWLSALAVSTHSFSSVVILFASQILKGSGHGVQHLEALGFWTLAIVWNSEY